MRTFFIALVLLQGLAFADDPMAPATPVPKARFTYPTGGAAIGGSIVDEQNNPVFDLPETRQAPAEQYTKDGRPIADQSPLNSDKLAEIENLCRGFKEKGQMELYRKCIRSEKAKAIAEIQSSFDRTNRTKEQPFRKSDSVAPLLDEQRKANKAFEAQEND